MTLSCSLSSRAPERVLAVDRGDYLISLRAEPNPQHFQICGVVIDHQYTRPSLIMLRILDDQCRLQVKTIAIQVGPHLGSGQRYPIVTRGRCL